MRWISKLSVVMAISFMISQPVFAGKYLEDAIRTDVVFSGDENYRLALYSPFEPAHNIGHIWGGLVAAGISALAFGASQNVRAGSRDFARFIGIVYGLKAIFRFGGGH